jgi:hypothetical protein
MFVCVCVFFLSQAGNVTVWNNKYTIKYVHGKKYYIRKIILLYYIMFIRLS